MKVIILLLLIIIIFPGITTVEAQVVANGNKISSFFPPKLTGWQLKGNPRMYDRGNIFDYMNGAGEFYLAYDFKKLHVAEYIFENSDPVNVEVYQMATSEDAFGIYSHDLDGEKVDIGNDAIYAQGFLKGWKSNVFIRIVAMQETADNKQFILSFAQQLFDQLNEAGEKPGILVKLPHANLIADSVSYFHKNTSLNNIYFLATTNILNLSEKTNAVSAQYKVTNSDKIRLIIIEYNKNEEAEISYHSFNKAFFPELPAPIETETIRLIENNKHIGAKLLGRYLYLIFEVQDEKHIKNIFDLAEVN